MPFHGFPGQCISIHNNTNLLFSFVSVFFFCFSRIAHTQHWPETARQAGSQRASHIRWEVPLRHSAGLCGFVLFGAWHKFGKRQLTRQCLLLVCSLMLPRFLLSNLTIKNTRSYGFSPATVINSLIHANIIYYNCTYFTIRLNHKNKTKNKRNRK